MKEMVKTIIWTYKKGLSYRMKVERTKMRRLSRKTTGNQRAANLRRSMSSKRGPNFSDWLRRP